MKRQNEVLVGILTTVAVAILILGTYWLARGTFAGGYDLYTVTDWGQGLKTGQRVLFAGVSIGYVEDVELRMEGKLVIKMVIEEKYHVPKGSTAAVQPVGLFGDMIVAVTPAGPSDEVHAEGDTLPPGKPAATPADVIAGADSVIRSVRAILAGVQSQLIDAGAITELRNTLTNTNRLVLQLTSIAATQSAELSATMGSLRRTVAALDSAELDSTLGNFNRASANLAALTEGLERTAQRLSATVAKLESGDGTAAKLLNDPGLYNDLREVTTNLSTLVTDFRANPRKYLDFSFSVFGGRRRDE
jgi:phospholipid/cholesterol/gamma-HCH transport system substrate-binding protein